MKKLITITVIAIAVTAGGYLLVANNGSKSNAPVKQKENVVTMENTKELANNTTQSNEIVETKEIIEPQSPIESSSIADDNNDIKYLTTNEVMALIVPTITGSKELNRISELRYSLQSINRAVMNTYVSNPSLFTQDNTAKNILECTNQLADAIESHKLNGEIFRYTEFYCKL